MYCKCYSKIIIIHQKRNLVLQYKLFLFFPPQPVNLNSVTAAYAPHYSSHSTFSLIIYFTCTAFYSHLIKIFKRCTRWPSILHQIQNGHHASAFQLTQDRATFKIPRAHLSVWLDTSNETCPLVTHPKRGINKTLCRYS